MDESFSNLKVIDIFESLIWTERYNQSGDFEIYAPVDIELFKLILNKPTNVDYYSWLEGSIQQMIIESAEIKTEVESGTYMIISGRSFESMLERRIIWTQTVLKGNLQDEIEKLLNENVINPSIEDRKIPNFVFKRSTDPNITALTIEAQYTGDNLYDTIVSICESYKIGFQVYLDESHRFVFELYFGVDRSYDQTENPYVIFSPKFENVINSNYLRSERTLKNVALVAGEDAGTDRKRTVVGSGKGLARRELYIDARDIQSESDEGVMSDEDYYAQLKERGVEKLSQHKITEAFEGQVTATNNFEYGVDYTRGDIVQMTNEYGMEAKVRITEFVRIQDESGYETYPTFSIMDEEGGE